MALWGIPPIWERLGLLPRQQQKTASEPQRYGAWGTWAHTFNPRKGRQISELHSSPMIVRYDALSETLSKKEPNETEGPVTATREKRNLSFLFQAPRMIGPEPVPCQTTAPTEKPYGTFMLPTTHNVTWEECWLWGNLPIFLCILDTLSSLKTSTIKLGSAGRSCGHSSRWWG